jgi:hypothetical protein
MEQFIAIILSVILGYLSSRLANRKGMGILSTAVSLAGICIIVTSLYLGSLHVFSLLREEKHLEGRWIEKYEQNGAIVFGLADLTYNALANYLEFRGYGYYEDGTIAGQWKTIKARYDGLQYDYLYEGESQNRNKARVGHRKGVGIISFDVNYGGATGYFFSTTTDSTIRRFNLFRISKAELIDESIRNPSSFVARIYQGKIKLNELSN